MNTEYWDAYLMHGDRHRVGRLRNYWGNIYNWLREMAEELTILKESYRRMWLAENRPYWLDSVLARYDRAILAWLTKSKSLEEAVRVYNATSILPDPEAFDWTTTTTVTQSNLALNPSNSCNSWIVFGCRTNTIHEIHEIHTNTKLRSRNRQSHAQTSR